MKAVSSTLKATFQTANSKVSRAAEEQLAEQIRAANSHLHNAAEDIASKLPKNNSVLYVSGKPVQLCPFVHSNNTLSAPATALAYWTCSQWSGSSVSQGYVHTVWHIVSFSPMQ